MIEVTRVGLIKIGREEAGRMDCLKWVLIDFSYNRMKMRFRTEKVDGCNRVRYYKTGAEISAGDLVVKEGVKGVFKSTINGRVISINTDKDIS